MKKRLRQILLILAALLIVATVFLYFYLYTDNHKIDFSEADLIQISSDAIPAESVESDSFTKNIIAPDEWFRSPDGRVMLLRGINLSGSTKTPPNVPSQVKDGFFEGSTVNFVGRPFPLEQAEEHFRRLNAWGFHFIRFLITWEAIEHEGPGKYDEAYLDYVYQIVKKAGEYNLNVFIDPHQDVWSRFTGGDGAPMWTLEKIGFNVENLHPTGTAIVHNLHGSPFPRMVWPSNYSKLATATMFTLFFAGNDFAPQTKVDSLSAQDFLQTHYLNAIQKVAEKLQGLPNVIGFDTFNEPSTGYIGIADLNSLGFLTIHNQPTYFQGMALGAGIPQEVDFYELGMLGFKKTKKVVLNSDKLSAWESPEADIWRKQSIWQLDESGNPQLLKPDYFAAVKGQKVNFPEQYFKPFAEKYRKMLHSIDSNWLIFAEPALMTELPKMDADIAKHYVNAGHYYDGLLLLSKSFSPILAANSKTMQAAIGKKQVRLTLESNLKSIQEETASKLGARPTLIGEIGIPFDMNEKKAYKTSDFTAQEAAIDRSFQALEANLLNYTLWNYTPDNTNERGDNWNEEDLSVFSISQQKDPNDVNSGGRALRAVVRPYPHKVSGIPLVYHFNKNRSELYFKFKNDPSLTKPTEIWLPDFHYEKGYTVWISKGRLAKDEKRRLLLFYPDKTEEYGEILVRPRPSN